MSEDSLMRTPLYEEHLASGAKMVPFSGWAMPLQYSSILKEHIHTREQASLFDTCHMGELYVEGATAQPDLSRLVTCEVEQLRPGRCRYGFLLNENGAILDDLIVYSENEGLEYDEEEFEMSKDIITRLIKAYIARDLWEMEEFYRVYNHIDPIFKKAVEVARNPELYKKKLQAYTGE